MLPIHYPRYFRLGQPIHLERVFLDPALQDRSDRLSGQIASCREAEFVVHIPYDAAQGEPAYPFFPGMPFILHGEYHGLGVRLSATFEERLSAGLVRLVAGGDLQFRYRHARPRMVTELWHGCHRLPGTLLQNLRLWRRQVDRLRVDGDLAALTPFVRREVAIDEDGVDIVFDEPAAIAELALVYLALDDRKPLVCTLAEVVQVAPAGDGTPRQRAGLHFINILDDDRTRIARLVRDLRREERMAT